MLSNCGIACSFRGFSVTHGEIRPSEHQWRSQGSWVSGSLLLLRPLSLAQKAARRENFISFSVELSSKGNQNKRTNFFVFYVFVSVFWWKERVFSITFSRLFVAMPQRCLFHSAKPSNPLLRAVSLARPNYLLRQSLLSMQIAARHIIKESWS